MTITMTKFYPQNKDSHWSIYEIECIYNTGGMQQNKHVNGKNERNNSHRLIIQYNEIFYDYKIHKFI